MGCLALLLFVSVVHLFIGARCSRPKKSTETIFYTEELPLKQFSTVSITGNKAGNMMPAIGNGYVGTTLYSDTVHVSGLYNGKAFPKHWPVYPIMKFEHTHRARLPSTCSLDFTVLGLKGKTAYALNVLEGIFYRFFEVDIEDGGTLEIEERFFAHRQRHHIVCVELTVKNFLKQNITLNITNNFGVYSKDIDFRQYTVDKEKEMEMAYGKINDSEEIDSLQSKVALAFQDIPAQIDVEASDWRTWYFISAVATSIDTKFDPWRQAEGMWKEASRDERYIQWHHRKAWEELWNSGKIDVEGNLQLSQAIYSSMYAILSSTRADWPYGLSPGGLPGGEEYMGHTFWDQDIWMFPFLLLLHPDLARASLRYRYDRLPAARRLARIQGYKGAMFPWESSLTGMETSPGRKYKNQLHITGDVAYTAKLYWWATKDLHWLREIGFELAYQTAEFWVNRVRLNKKKDRYDINYVMPPDEYQFPVDNSVYTNVVAKQNIEFAIECGKILDRYIPKFWKNIAAKMYIPFDKKKQYHPEFESFHLGMYTKQADTILIGYPLMYDMPIEVRRNDLEFYENVTDPHGPAMTHSMATVGWLEVGDKERANKAFVKNFDNINGPFHIWTERTGRRGAVNFITGAGGFLQAVLFGYGGFRFREDHLEFNPTLTYSSTKFTITGVDYLGTSMTFKVSKKKVRITITAQQEIAPHLKVTVNGKTQQLHFNRTVIVGRGKGAIRMSL